MFQHDCSFGPDTFRDVMMNLIRNPNINSSWLFRADILFEQHGTAHDGQNEAESCRTAGEAHGDGEWLDWKVRPRVVEFKGFRRETTIVRRLVPRNKLRDKAVDQTCLMYSSGGTHERALGQVPDEAQKQSSLVAYVPHLSSKSQVPFYHPSVRGLGFLHVWNPIRKAGTISIHYLFFPEDSMPGSSSSSSSSSHGNPVKLVRTALALLTTLHKHGAGRADGYVKRVHHDSLVPQARLQNRYAHLKTKHARRLIKEWVEVTDPGKHVFEDLGIAAFLIELWDDMYTQPGKPFPGFVDIGCGNGLLVHILSLEGFRGWGFDARARKSWDVYKKVDEEGRESLQQKVLVPTLVQRPKKKYDHQEENDQNRRDDEGQHLFPPVGNGPLIIHDGVFPRGTFIISNHADELTPWTPILAAQSYCPFMIIPCCSHNLTGARYRAPAPKDKSSSDSCYSSLVSWVGEIAVDCGWQPETEMLRIPSTRNTAIIGRRRLVMQNTRNTCVVGRERRKADVDIAAVVEKYGGVTGYYENALRLVKVRSRGH